MYCLKSGIGADFSPSTSILPCQPLVTGIRKREIFTNAICVDVD
jgi:hypothetical protein